MTYFEFTNNIKRKTIFIIYYKSIINVFLKIDFYLMQSDNEPIIKIMKSL